MHCYIDIFGFTQVGLNFTSNWLINVLKSNGYPENFINNSFKITNIEYKKKHNCA